MNAIEEIVNGFLYALDKEPMAVIVLIIICAGALFLSALDLAS